MKTRTILSTLAAMLVTGMMAMASDPVDPKVAVLNPFGSSIFKVIYEAGQRNDVTVEVYNNNGTKVYAETIYKMEGFIRPLNFDGMKYGEYTVHITDKNGRTVQAINYTRATANADVMKDANADASETSVRYAHIAKLSGESKYLLSVPAEAQGEINVKIYDGYSNLVHNQTVKVNGDLGLVYNLQQFSASPIFVLTDAAGNTKRVK